MKFSDLPWIDRQEIADSLVSALREYASGPNGEGNPLAHAPDEHGETDASLVYQRGWARKVDGRWHIDLDAYLEYRSTQVSS